MIQESFKQHEDVPTLRKIVNEYTGASMNDTTIFARKDTYMTLIKTLALNPEQGRIKDMQWTNSKRPIRVGEHRRDESVTLYMNNGSRYEVQLRQDI
jgi:hypothetical protein